MTPLLEVRSLTISVGGSDRTLVGPLDLDVAGGERIGLVGRSGAGKSLTGTALLGLATPGLTVGGSITWARDVDTRWTRRTGVLVQDSASALDPLTRVGRQVGHAARGDRARVAELADRLGLDPALLRRWPAQLSGGQRQRAALAMALADPPALLVADEPTSALDAAARDDVLACLDTAIDDTALLLVSHDLGVVDRLCDRVLVIDDGVLVGADHPAARSLVSASRALDG